jgi:hypothetical protein
MMTISDRIREKSRLSPTVFGKSHNHRLRKPRYLRRDGDEIDCSKCEFTIVFLKLRIINTIVFYNAATFYEIMQLCTWVLGDERFNYGYQPIIFGNFAKDQEKPVSFDPDVLASVNSVQGHTIRLTYRQWVHVTESHDYMVSNRDKLLETVAGEEEAVIALRHYDSTNITEKNCVVIYRDEEDGFVITAFLTSRPDKIVRRRRNLWKRPQST